MRWLLKNCIRKMIYKLLVIASRLIKCARNKIHIDHIIFLLSFFIHWWGYEKWNEKWRIQWIVNEIEEPQEIGFKTHFCTLITISWVIYCLGYVRIYFMGFKMSWTIFWKIIFLLKWILGEKLGRTQAYPLVCIVEHTLLCILGYTPNV